jgi:4a-hydroxytetrahydrobiopterin dehydratase
MSLLSQAEVTEKLALLPQWQIAGDTIWREFKFADFVVAMKFVNLVAEEAEKAAHHPDIDIRWNKVKLALSSHDAGGLTQKDFDLATVANSLL